MTTRERRDLLAIRFDTIAVRRDPVEIIAYPAGTAPADLPRRGYRVGPALAPFPDQPSTANSAASA
jgi:hypothetical protein